MWLCFHFVIVGMRQDQQLQQCQGSQFKRTFPDIDYAFFGYDIFFGFPLANGHDPGFTYPIFEAEYSEGRQTSDCRYKIPDGLVVVPDVSCVTSFSSTIIQNKYEFSKALSVSATANGGAYGVSFSASAGYKTSSSEMATGESVKIISTAKCVYYFSKLSEEYIPRFTKAFLMWVKKLNNTTDNEIFIDFLNKYGTHYLTYATFGARFTYENTMKSKTFNKKQEQGVNVAIQASYSGIFSAGAGFNMDSSQKNEASDFQKSVTTKTIAVGATPPANGDAMEWASGVKDNPVPMEYKLKPISNLFTEAYMGNLHINVQQISQHLKNAEYKYCKYLKGLNKLDSCDPIQPGLILTETKIIASYGKRVQAASFDECIDLCENEIVCLAASFCKECTKRSNSYNTCYMSNGLNNRKRTYSAEETTKTAIRWDTVVFDFKIPYGNVFQLDKTALTGRSRLSINISQYTHTADQCLQHCLRDAHCVAFSFCTCRSRKKKCQTYAEQRINGMTKDTETTTYFMPKFKREAATLPRGFYAVFSKVRKI